MSLKEKYKIVLENFAKRPAGSFPIYDLVDTPDFLLDESKSKEMEGDYVFNYELTDKATDKDYQDYIDYVLAYTGQDLSLYIIEEKGFSNFGKK